jgi:hypothetical protein
VRWHVEGKDPVLKAVVLKILIEVALVAIQDKQPVPPYLTGLCALIKVL